jgi:alkylhydroperoxidase family enzyme
VAWIETIPDDEWHDGRHPELGELHASVVDRGNGRVDHIMTVHSLDPRAMAAHQGLYASVMAGTATLRKAERELIALVVSLENRCHY